MHHTNKELHLQEFEGGCGMAFSVLWFSRGLGLQKITSLPVHSMKLRNSTARWLTTTLLTSTLSQFSSTYKIRDDWITFDGSITKIMYIYTHTHTHCFCRHVYVFSASRWLPSSQVWCTWWCTDWNIIYYTCLSCLILIVWSADPVWWNEEIYRSKLLLRTDMLAVTEKSVEVLKLAVGMRQERQVYKVYSALPFVELVHRTCAV
jgi:hypothetical protein